jgi:protein-tyrosine phosphatase
LAIGIAGSIKWLAWNDKGINPINKSSVLFVCTANLCRSAMAEYVFLNLLKIKAVDPTQWIVESAGLQAMENLPAVPMAQQVCLEAGYDLSNHRSRLLSQELMNTFNLVLVMEKWQRQQIHRLYPQQTIKTFLLSEMIGMEKDIIDPFGMPSLFHQKVLQEIQQYITLGFGKIQNLAIN